MADATIKASQQVRFRAVPLDAAGAPRGIDGRVRLVAVDPADGVEIAFPPGWGPGPDQPDAFEAVLLGPDATETGPTVKLVGDAYLTAAEVLISSRTWQIDAAVETATVLDGSMVVEPRGT